jgi:6-phosphofructokinase 2
MPRIVTLTVNPAVDKSASVDNVVPEHKLRCDRPRFEPGGGGINVSRAVKKLGGDSTAYFAAGEPAGDMLARLLADEGVNCRRLDVKGRTRENLIVYEKTSGKQYRFGMPGPELDEAWAEYCLERLRAIDPAPEYIVAGGSLPPGLPVDFYARVAETGKEMGSRVVVDTSKEALARAAEAELFMLKPNLRELSQIAGRELEEEEQQIAAAGKLIERGKAELVMVSMGAGGALLVTKDGGEHLRTPTVPIRSKVGAGDSTVAGVVLALARGMEVREAVRFGMAAGAAAVMTPGTELCRREDAERLFEKIRSEN